ncbi:hypothetical protein [uncultured Victivallis sp.]|uniref:hypothetical protein n=1 Tax=uncultured Victivallis sp. TaxID=354118 RepID=UPI00259748B1|nr:hypothetical protein [uncultured Victivallis sp.]
MEENRKSTAAREARQGGGYGVVALQQLKNLPHCGNDIIGKEFVITDIPEAVEDKEVLVKELEKQGVRGSNIQALCIYLAKVFNFENRKDFIAWARRVLNADDEGNIEHRATVGAMLNAFKNDPETFVLLMSVPYRKNLVLSSVADRPEFKRFLREKQAEIFKYSRECLVILRNDYFRLNPAAPKQDKAEQLVFDFAAVDSISRAAQSDPDKAVKNIIRKLRKRNVPEFMHGSLTMCAAAVMLWEENPEARPDDLAFYTGIAEEIYNSLKAITPAAEK